MRLGDQSPKGVMNSMASGLMDTIVLPQFFVWYCLRQGLNHGGLSPVNNDFFERDPSLSFEARETVSTVAMVVLSLIMPAILIFLGILLAHSLCRNGKGAAYALKSRPALPILSALVTACKNRLHPSLVVSGSHSLLIACRFG